MDAAPDASADDEVVDVHDGDVTDEWVDEYEAPVSLEIDRNDLVGDARRRYGKGGGILAAGMLGLADAILGEKHRPDSVQVQEAPTDPIDVDKSGIQVMIDDLTSVEVPPLERKAPVGVNKKKSRHR